MLDEAISGSLLTIFLFDVSDEIRLDELRQVLNALGSAPKPAFRQPAPAYVQFASPQVLEFVEGLTLNGEQWVGRRIAYYDSGVASVKMIKQLNYAIKIVGRPESDRGGAVKHV
jgi:hypothetical protein